MSLLLKPTVKKRLDTLGMAPPARDATRESLLAFLQAEKQRTGAPAKKLNTTPN